MPYLMIIPSILFFAIALFNICPTWFTTAEKVRAIAALYGALAIVVFISTRLAFLDVDIFGNLVITGSLAGIVYSKTRQRLLSAYYAVLAVVVTMISGSAVGSLLEMVLRLSIYDNRDNLALYFAGAVPVFPLCYGLSRALGRRVRQHYARLESEARRAFIRYGFISSALVYALAHVNLLAAQLPISGALLSSLNVVAIVTVFFVSVFMTAAYSLAQQRQAEAELKSAAQAQLEAYTKRLEDAYDDIRRFQHDQLNLLYGLVGYADEGNQAGFRAYLNKNLAGAEEAQAILDKAMYHLRFIHIPALKGLLSVKLAQAQTRGIRVTLDITAPVERVPIEQTELCRVVGVMLDNAVEELAAHDPSARALRFGVLADESGLLVVCANACKTPPPIERIFAKGYTTKGTGRGMGLYNLKQACDSCGNVLLSARTENNMFTIMAMISG